MCMVLYASNNLINIYAIRTVKKEKNIFLIHIEIRKGSGAKSCMRKGFLIYEGIRKYFYVTVEDIAYFTKQKVSGPSKSLDFAHSDRLESLKWPHLVIFKD
jgi:hypothetical protein